MLIDPDRELTSILRRCDRQGVRLFVSGDDLVIGGKTPGTRLRKDIGRRVDDLVEHLKPRTPVKPADDRCVDCGKLVPYGNRYRCARCVEAAYARLEARR